MKKIVSLLPSATEILFALGLGDQVVGVTFECNHPPEARSRPIVTTSALPENLSPAEIDEVVKQRMADGEDIYHLDQDTLAAIDPDLILTQDLCAVCAIAMDDVDQALEFLGCRAEVLTLDPMTLDQVIDSVLDVGRATGTEAKARSLVDKLRARLEKVAAATTESERSPRTMVIEWTDPAFTAGHWVPDLVSAAGGTPVLAHPGERSTGVPWSTVTGTETDAVIVAPCGFGLDGAVEQATSLVDKARVPAHAEVWAVDADAFVVRPGPRLVDGVEVFASILHPELVGQPDPTTARRVA